MGYKLQALQVVFYWLSDCVPALQDFVPFETGTRPDCQVLLDAIDHNLLKFLLQSLYTRQRNDALSRLVYDGPLLTDEEIDALLE